MKKDLDDLRIRKVGVLGDRAKATAIKMGLKDDDLVLVKTIIKSGELPIYELEKIEGSPTQYLIDKFLKPRRSKTDRLTKSDRLIEKFGELYRLGQIYDGNEAFRKWIGDTMNHIVAQEKNLPKCGTLNDCGYSVDGECLRESQCGNKKKVK